MRMAHCQDYFSSWFPRKMYIKKKRPGKPYSICYYKAFSPNQCSLLVRGAWPCVTCKNPSNETSSLMGVGLVSDGNDFPPSSKKLSSINARTKQVRQPLQQQTHLIKQLCGRKAEREILKKSRKEESST